LSGVQTWALRSWAGGWGGGRSRRWSSRPGRRSSESTSQGCSVAATTNTPSGSSLALYSSATSWSTTPGPVGVPRAHRLVHAAAPDRVAAAGPARPDGVELVEVEQAGRGRPGRLEDLVDAAAGGGEPPVDPPAPGA